MEPSPRESLPGHVAVIMDGNGRWAHERGLPRLRGHQAGADTLREVTRHCRSAGVRELTVYALSTENFQRRPEAEVRFLTQLLKAFLISERPELLENDIRLRAIGDTAAFPEDVRKELEETIRLTRDRKSMVLRLALNYGSRQEILEAARRIALDALDGRLAREEVERLSEEAFAARLSDPEMTAPDLLIRTAGEMRLSNFLLWQCSYSEIWVTQRLWPDFRVADLEEALESFARRKRKFGAIEPRAQQAAAPESATQGS